jgi:hypothetical protein
VADDLALSQALNFYRIVGAIRHAERLARALAA